MKGVNKMRKVFKNLTPVQAFRKYADVGVEKPVEFFLSNFIHEGYTDLTAMCRRYAAEAVEIEHRLATTEEIDYVAELLEKYIRDYVKKIGGESRIKLYTEEECNEIFESDWEIISELLEKFRRR